MFGKEAFGSRLVEPFGSFWKIGRMVWGPSNASKVYVRREYWGDILNGGWVEELAGQAVHCALEGEAEKNLKRVARTWERWIVKKNRMRTSAMPRLAPVPGACAWSRCDCFLVRAAQSELRFKWVVGLFLSVKIISGGNTLSFNVSSLGGSDLPVSTESHVLSTRVMNLKDCTRLIVCGWKTIEGGSNYIGSCFDCAIQCFGVLF